MSGIDRESAGRLGEALSSEGFDGLIVVAPSSRDSDLAPFVGDVHLGESLVVVTAGGDVLLGFLTDMERDEAAATGFELAAPDDLGMSDEGVRDAPPGQLWAVVLEHALARVAAQPGHWAVAGHPAAGTVVEACAHLTEAGWRFSSGGEILRRWRKLKPAAWEGRMALPARGVCAAMRAVATLLRGAETGDGGLTLAGEPLRVGRLREAARREFARFGLNEPEGNIFAAGSAAGVPHSTGDSAHVLQPGEPLVVDLFPQAGLFADCTRTFCVGDPSPDFARAHAAVLQALLAAHEGCRPGVRAWELQKGTCEAFEAAGYATVRSAPGTQTGYVHGLGHGVGYELHEYPSFRESAGAEGLLEVGDLLTLEPGLYDPGAGYGVRLEDLCYLGPDGLVNLTPLPYDWDPEAWDPGAWEASVASAPATG